jgi:hypothetical protein
MDQDRLNDIAVVLNTGGIPIPPVIPVAAYASMFEMQFKQFGLLPDYLKVFKVIALKYRVLE